MHLPLMFDFCSFWHFCGALSCLDYFFVFMVSRSALNWLNCHLCRNRRSAAGSKLGSAALMRSEHVWGSSWRLMDFAGLESAGLSVCCFEDSNLNLRRLLLQQLFQSGDSPISRAFWSCFAFESCVYCWYALQERLPFNSSSCFDSQDVQCRTGQAFRCQYQGESPAGLLRWNLLPNFLLGTCFWYFSRSSVNLLKSHSNH